MTINRLLELHELAKQESRKYVRRRLLFPQLVRGQGRHFIGIVGARGTKTPDFLIENKATKLAVEIGGRGKGREQLKGVQVDRKIVFIHSPTPEKGRLPLFLLGYLS